MSVAASTLVEVFSPSVALGGGLLAAFPWLRRDSTWARAAFVAVPIVLMWRYLLWRLFETLPPAALSADFIAGIIFALVETLAFVGGTLSLFFLARTKDRTSEVEANAAWLIENAPPLVDVCICTYNEEPAILERTIIGALALQYPNFRVWVLDDGRRPWLKALCAQMGCHYLTRADNAHAKAGNINHALGHFAQLEKPPDFVAILDADFVPMANFLARTLCLFRAPDVGVVQTPQHFVNPDPIQANLAAAHVWPDEQRYFFDVVMSAKDAWGLAFCCGTSAVIRFAALQKIGGFPTDSVTEDYLLTLRLQKAAYRTVYLNEKLSLGLAPEGLKEYTVQRARWCLGFMQIIRGASGPFRLRSGLPLLHRLSLIESFLYWFVNYAYRLMCIIVPLLYWLFGVQAVQADVVTTLTYFIPFFVAQVLATGWIAGGRMLPVMAEVSQLLVAPEILKAGLVGLLKPKGHKFNVTAKGGLRDKRVFQWNLLFRFTFLLGLTIAGVLIGAVMNDGRALENAGGLCLFWSWYNIVLLTVACVVCVEQPRYRKDERFRAFDTATVVLDGASHRCKLLDCSAGGMRLVGAPPAPVGASVSVLLAWMRLEAKIVRATATDFALRLEGAGDRETMIRYLYSGRDIGTEIHVQAWHVVLTIARRLFR